MKPVYLFLTLQLICLGTTVLLCPRTLNAQTTEGNVITGHHYVFNTDVPVELYDFIENNPADFRFMARRGQVFTVHSVQRNRIVIRFWRFRRSNHDTAQRLNLGYEDEFPVSYRYIDSATNGHYFSISPTEFNAYCSVYHPRTHSFTWGLLLMPVKLRFGNNAGGIMAFSNNYTLGTSAGYELALHGRLPRSISLLGTVGISSVTLDSSDTRGFQPQSVTAAAFTWGVGLVYAHQSMQVGIFTGRDYVGGNTGKHWLYQGKQWLSVGIGLALFQKGKEKSDDGKNSQ